MNPKTFSDELRRRNVYKVAIAYAAIAWLLIEVTSVSVHLLEAPSGLIKAVVILMALGFVATAYISWAFESTPQGLKRTEKLSPEEVKVLPTWSKRKFTAFIVGTALLAASLLTFDLLRSKSASLPATAPAATNNQ